jgi:hypothetical protein
MMYLPVGNSIYKVFTGTISMRCPNSTTTTHTILFLFFSSSSSISSHTHSSLHDDHGGHLILLSLLFAKSSNMTKGGHSNTTLYIVYVNVLLYATCFQLQRPIEPFMVEKLGAQYSIQLFNYTLLIFYQQEYLAILLENMLNCSLFFR